MRFLCRLVVALIALFANWAWATPIALAGPTTSWRPVLLPSGNEMDYIEDAQTGRAEADIVGVPSQPGLYWAFDDGGTPGILTDGYIGFRFRLASDEPSAADNKFDSVAFVGVDANQDGAIDLYLGADNSGSGRQLKIWGAGGAANVSPRTIRFLVPSGAKVYDESAGNYNFSPVTAANDPAVGSVDLDHGGRSDFFLSFQVPFADVVAEMARLTTERLAIDEYTSLRFIAGTSTQLNVINEDLYGLPRRFNDRATWTELGALSSSYPANSSVSADLTEMPEPSTLLLAAAGLIGLGGRLRRRLR